MKILFTDFSTCLNSVDELKTRARGGMVSSLRILPDVLSKLNNEIAVWTDVKTGGMTENGVRWYTLDDFDEVVRQKWDFLIHNRGIGSGFTEVNARHRILWTHDLVHGGHAPNPEHLRALSATVFMSRYSEWTWRLFYRQIGKSYLIPNGVDRDLFYPREKDLNYLIYISAPNRGLHRLGIIFNTIKQRIERPIMFNAYSNMAVLHPADTEAQKGYVPQEDGGEAHGTTYKSNEQLGVNVLDPIPQMELAEELGKAGLMIMPTGYPEICSNSVLQALASGTPIVTTGNMGATCEWVKDGWNGILTTTHLEDYMVYLMEVTRGAVKILENEKLHRKMIKNAAKTKGLYTWAEIGMAWQRMLKGKF